MFSTKYIQKCKNYSQYNLCISCSLFRMKNAYRNFPLYIQALLRWCYRIPKTAYIRLYVDASVLQDKNFENLLIKNIPHLEVVLFEFPDFVSIKSEAEYFHDGTTGTLGRFLALYHEPPLPRNIKYVWVSDVDMPAYVFSFNNIRDIQTYNVDLSYYSKACYIKEWHNPSLENPILAGKIITKTSVKYDVNILNTFLKNVLHKKYDIMKIEILTRLSKMKGGHYMRNEDVEYFPYGFDELFTNHYLIKDIQKHRHLIYYDLVFKELQWSYDIPEFKEMKVYDDNVWRGIDKERNYQQLLRVSKEIYDKIPQKNRCLTEFDKYKNQTIINGYVWGLTTLIVKN